METVFKEGQEVFDEVFREGKKGIVRIVSKNKFRDYVLVDFENSTPALYTFDGILIDIDGEFVDARPTLSVFETKYISKEDFKKVPTFEEAWDYTKNVYIDKIENFKKYEGYPSQELANAFEALRKLIFLRDYYNANWKPDWNNSDTFKYCIEIYRGNLESMNYNTTYKIMFFKTPEIRDRFFEDQRELLEIAKPLL